jgi:hypothetical protein
VLVQSALNWMVDNYPRLAEWVASARREAIEDQLGGLDQYSASPRKGVMYVCDNEVGRAAQMRLSLRLKSCKDRNETSSLSEDAQQNSRSATWRTPSCQTRRTCRRH